MTDVLFLHPVALDGRAAGWLGLEGVTAPSFPGHGGRLRRPGVTLDEAADEVAASTQGRMHVIGASFGGMLALHLALRHPDRVASLALCFTTARVTARTMLERASPASRCPCSTHAEPSPVRCRSPGWRIRCVSAGRSWRPRSSRRSESSRASRVSSFSHLAISLSVL